MASVSERSISSTLSLVQPISESSLWRKLVLPSCICSLILSLLTADDHRWGRECTSTGKLTDLLSPQSTGILLILLQALHQCTCPFSLQSLPTGKQKPEVEGRVCPNYPRNHDVRGSLPLVGSPKENQSWVRGQIKSNTEIPSDEIGVAAHLSVRRLVVSLALLVQSYSCYFWWWQQ